MAVYEKIPGIPHALKKDRLFYTTVQEILKRLEESYHSVEDISVIAETNKTFDDCLIALHYILGETLSKALELVETGTVKHYHITSENLGIFQVCNKGKTYTVFPHINYCPCQAYKYQVANGSVPLCKHVLASSIAKITNQTELIEVTQSQLYDLLKLAAGIKKSIKMNKQEDWHNQNQYIEPCTYPQTEIPPVFPHVPQTNNWVHVPPQTMPWGLPANSHPAIVRFTAGDYTPQHHPVKRKINVDFEVRAPKLLVTEEKMAAHMSNLHISDVDIPCLPADEEVMETDRLPKLVVCDEVKNIKAEPLIPESILNKIERPKMAVVLWQPPGNDIVSKLTELRKETKTEKEEKEENAMIIENNNVDNTFRPIDPVPMHSTPQNQFLQPTPQFHGYFPYSS